jgi:hypothetical protein
LTGSFPAKEESVYCLIDAGVGFMATPRDGQFKKAISTLPFWAADNRCFSESEKFDLDKYCAWLERLEVHRPKCLFAATPDVVGDAIKTLERSIPTMPIIRRTGYPVAFVAQDGISYVPWFSFDVLFIGGTDAFKLSSQVRSLVLEAKARRKRVHMGRVNSWKRYRYAREIGCDSVDGTCIAFAPDVNSAKVGRWATSHRQLTLEDIA